MKTQKVNLIVVLMLFAASAMGQVKGNYDYRAASNYVYQPQVVIPSAQAIANVDAVGHHSFSIKGLYNCKADSYLAIFAVTQVGETQAEADALLRTKIDAIKSSLKSTGANSELYVDMISFLPIYEVEVTKKIFSKTTYNEVPKGFELKKNLHFRYKNAQVLDDLVTLCAEQEIYDLVRVDYFIENMEAKRAEMMKKAEEQLKAEMGRYQRLLDEDWSEKLHQMGDGFAMHYPMEQYKSYQTYCSNALVFSSSSASQQHTTTTSQFYMPKMAKGYDYVINPSILEPVVQLEYELVMRLSPKPQEPTKVEVKEVVKTEIKKEIFLVTPDGQVKQINF